MPGLVSSSAVLGPKKASSYRRDKSHTYNISSTKREEGREEGREEKGRMERRGREEEKEEGERKKEELNVPQT